MHVDFKVTTWERHTLDTDELSEEDINEIKRKIKEGIITNGNDLIEEVGSSHGCETLYDVEEQMTVKANGGAATIELFEDNNGEVIITNVNTPG